jgi:hypothetical protein
MFLRAVGILALPADHQIDWLRSLGMGEPGLCDELADEYYQQWVLLGQFIEAGLVPQRAEEDLNRLNDLLGALIRPGSEFAAIEALRSAAEWQEVRQLAAQCLISLK